MFRLCIHGGAGARPGALDAPDGAYHAALRQVLEDGGRILADGGAALDAVVACVVALEDDPLFNAGRGAVLNAESFCEMDASLMEGATLRAGAVAGVRRVKNPILAARAVWARGEQVFLHGGGAEAVAAGTGVETRDEGYFVTPARREQWEETAAGAGPLPGDKPGSSGTVGAVAFDRHGNVAAATSTGGTVRKPAGRIGDTPVIGAGTYADNASCAVSCTGDGEAFLRVVAAHEVAARVRLRREHLAAAVEATLARVAALGGEGGIIAIAPGGAYAMAFRAGGMHRGTIGPDFRVETALW